MGIDKKAAGVAAAFVILNILDYSSTDVVLRMGGVEYNPIINAVGTDNLLPFKIGVTAAGLALAKASGKWDLLRAVNIGLAVIVAGNYAAVGAGHFNGITPQ